MLLLFWGWVGCGSSSARKAPVERERRHAAPLFVERGAHVAGDGTSHMSRSSCPPLHAAQCCWECRVLPAVLNGEVRALHVAPHVVSCASCLALRNPSCASSMAPQASRIARVHRIVSFVCRASRLTHGALHGLGDGAIREFPRALQASCCSRRAACHKPRSAVTAGSSASLSEFQEVGGMVDEHVWLGFEQAIDIMVSPGDSH